jgi:hypothetical protein
LAQYSSLQLLTADVVSAPQTSEQLLYTLYDSLTQEKKSIRRPQASSGTSHILARADSPSCVMCTTR